MLFMDYVPNFPNAVMHSSCLSVTNKFFQLALRLRCAAGQMQAALRGLVLLEVSLPVPWERLVEMRLGPRLDESSHHLFLEVMGK